MPVPKKIRVLIVDDEPDTLRLLEYWLESRKFDVRTAYQSAAALETAERFKPHVVIVDLWLPETTGWDLCKKLRALPATKEAALVVMSGRPPMDVEKLCKDAGVDRFMDKPPRRAVFDALVDSLAKA